METAEIKKQLGAGAVFPIGQENTEFSQYFTGKSYLNTLTSQGVKIYNVTFTPGTINAWHIHHKGGQILLVTSGEGYYQEWGEPVQKLQAGDVVHIPPEIKHWHGAAKNSFFQHLAVEIPVPGGSNEWLEAVDTNEYNKLD